MLFFFFFFPFYQTIAHPPCQTIHTFPPQWCTPNNFFLPCRQQLLMCLYFHPASHLLSSATISLVCESVHLPGGTYISWAGPSSAPSFVSPDTFLKVRYQQGRKAGGRWREDEVAPPTRKQPNHNLADKRYDGQASWWSGFSHHQLKEMQRGVRGMDEWIAGHVCMWTDLIAPWAYVCVCVCAEMQHWRCHSWGHWRN